MIEVMKPLKESKELRIFRSLNARGALTEKERKFYWKLEKGYEGEVRMSQLLEASEDIEGILLNDLLLENNNTTFQIDKVLIMANSIQSMEVKNNEDDYFIDDDGKWVSELSQRKILDPLAQVTRSEQLFKQTLLNLGSSLPLDAHLIFVNPTFFLYQAPLNKTIVFPTQINRYLTQLRMKSTKVNNYHYVLAERLMELRINDSRFSRVPRYSFEELEKGIVCGGCGVLGSDFIQGRRALVCKKCGYKEGITSAVLRSVMEFKFMFPDMKVTTNKIYEWCKIFESRKMIRRILSENFTLVGNARACYFE